MERVDGLASGATETYMIQGTEVNPFVVTTPTLETIESMENDGAPKYIYDQGLYYPASTGMYGYYCTGYESPGEWNDHSSFFALDGQDYLYPGLQSENLPYVYYTPNYGYTQSSFNPFNPYIPGAVIGDDGSLVGTQPYYSESPYEQPISSSVYYPYVLQSGLDSVPNGSVQPYYSNTSTSFNSAPNGPGVKENTPLVSGRANKATPRSVAGDAKAGTIENGFNLSHSLAKKSDGAKSSSTWTKQSAAVQSIASGSVPHSAQVHIKQERMGSAATQVVDQHTVGVSSSYHSSIRTATAANGLTDFGSNARGWPVADKPKPKSHYSGISKYGNENPDMLGEQNRGPRTNRSKNQSTPSVSNEAYSSGDTPAQEKIVIRADQYNKEDFSVNYATAKFFVIKSYSEDDVHKSIKYNVWSSTPNGNKRLENAYEDAHKIAARESRYCPIFLFFSVNASGQFCGVAEMVGPVDFNKDMNFWQQDKWSGSFPVKWHMVKDVPNSNFRHIILENNENKPVTNSRDTQEINYKPGLEMLNIFKNFTLKTSILDDFMYYEDRQLVMVEEKRRLRGRNYDGLIYVPAFIPPESRVTNQRPVISDKTKRNDPEGPGKMSVSSTDPDGSGKMPICSSDRVSLKPNIKNSSSGRDGVEENGFEDRKDVTSLLTIGSLTIDPKQNDVNSSVVAAMEVQETEIGDVVTVGSLPVKVNGFTKSSSSGVLTIGTIPVVTKSPNL